MGIITNKKAMGQWDMWNYRNQNLHISDVPTKSAILTHANARISYRFNLGTIGLSTIFHSLFKAKEHNLLSCPTIHKLGWFAAIYSAQ